MPLHNLNDLLVEEPADSREADQSLLEPPPPFHAVAAANEGPRDALIDQVEQTGMHVDRQTRALDEESAPWALDAAHRVRNSVAASSASGFALAAGSFDADRRASGRA